MKKRTLLSWSSGKDSAWALHVLRQQPDIELIGLFTTVNQEFERVAMHAVRTELLKQQAKAIGLPMYLVHIPYPCTNAHYEETMHKFTIRMKEMKVECVAFGDLFLKDIRTYREEKMADTDIKPIFPLWGLSTSELCHEMIDAGLKTRITCLDPKKVPDYLAGHEYNEDFLNALPEGVDPCGENGEFHTFVYDGPMFNHPVDLTIGETVEREGFVFTDLCPAESTN